MEGKSQHGAHFNHYEIIIKSLTFGFLKLFFKHRIKATSLVSSKSRATLFQRV